MRFLPLLALTLAVPATAQTAADRAKAFQLDTLAPAPAPAATPDAPPVLATPAVPDSAAVVAPPAAPTAPDTAAAPPAEGALRPTFTLDTPIAVLIADPAARAVLDRDLPGMSDDANLDKFAKLGLRQFQPLTGGQLTDAMLATVARDLSGLGGPLLAPIVATTGGTSKRNRDASR